MEVLIYEFEQSLAQEFCDIFCLTTVNINLFFNPAPIYTFGTHSRKVIRITC